jgi:hypothetical protein
MQVSLLLDESIAASLATKLDKAGHDGGDVLLSGH